MAGVINFIERQRQVLIYDYLVYVAGVDISAHIKDLAIFYQDRTGQGSVDITLSNPFDQWIMRTSNLANHWRLTNDRYTETPKQRIWLNKRKFCRQMSLKNTITLPAKFLGSLDGSLSTDSDPDIVQALKQASDQEFLERYSFGPGSCIFSKFDTIKVFIKNPYDISTADRWFPAFTGTVENHPFATNFVDGDSSVHLMGYDIKSTLQGMRIDVNPYNSSMWQPGGDLASRQRQQTVVFDSDAAGFFKDFFPQGNTPYSNVFAGKSFVDTISLITTGYTNWVNGGQKVNNGAPGIGIGFFEPGTVVRYSAKDNPAATGKYVTDLADWDNLCLFGEWKDGKATVSKTFWSYKQCNAVGTDSFWNGAHTPLHGKVHFLIPAEGLEVTNSIVETVEGISNIMASPDWTNRYALISQVCSQIDYEWTISGNGDMIFEFPMYDFYPENFGTNQKLYEVDHHVENEDVSDEGGEVISGLETNGNSTDIAQNKSVEAQQRISQGIAADGAMRAVAYSNTLASKVGAKIASKTFTGVPNLQALKKLTLFEFQKRLADANKLSINFSYRPYIRPNRPIHHKTRERIGKTTSVRLNIPSLRAGTISVGLHCVRTPLWKYNADTKKNQIYYQHIAGGAGMALSYNTVYEGSGATRNPGDTQSGLTLQAVYAKSNQSGTPGQ